jgi:three-Cys-motif partner protein
MKNYSLFKESKEQPQIKKRNVKKKNNDSFFYESKEQSQIKARIVKKYIWAWAKIIVPRAEKVAYIDLFAGRGRYEDGKKSTPLLVLESAIKDQGMREKLITIFNDTDSELTQSLQNEINLIPDINHLKHKPQVFNQEIGTEIVQSFEKQNFGPTLFFIDPCGYKGLSLRLINSVLKDWGCECIFFFNYNRISAALTNKKVEKHINALFGEERVKELRMKILSLSSNKKELLIMEAMEQALKEMGGKYVLPFCFKHVSANRTSHYIIFVSKHVRGYEIMKEIMAKESSYAEQAVPSFEYNPNADNQSSLLCPLDTLKDQLLKKFACHTMTRKEVYEQHHIGTRYIKENYRTALLELEEEEKIKTNPLATKRRKLKGEVTFSETNVKITFPEIMRIMGSK